MYRRNPLLQKIYMLGVLHPNLRTATFPIDLLPPEMDPLLERMDKGCKGCLPTENHFTAVLLFLGQLVTPRRMSVDYRPKIKRSLWSISVTLCRFLQLWFSFNYSSAPTGGYSPHHWDDILITSSYPYSQMSVCTSKIDILMMLRIVKIRKRMPSSFHACTTMSKLRQMNLSLPYKLHIITLRPSNQPFWKFSAPLPHRRPPELASSSLRRR